MVSLQAEVGFSIWRLFWKHDLSLVCVVLLSNYTLFSLRVVVGILTARPKASSIQWPFQAWYSKVLCLALFQRSVPLPWKVGTGEAGLVSDLHVCDVSGFGEP